MTGRLGRRHQGKSLKRSTESRQELRTVVVFTEGKNSEPDYVNALKKLPHVVANVALSIEIFPQHGVPLTLVQMAKAQKREGEIDECWCIFDIEWPENHPNLKEAVDQARANGINLAISNPCFELWLILHYGHHGGWCDTSTAESKSRSLDGRPGKTIVDADSYMPRRFDAARRAEQLDRRHANDGTKFPHNNPSSGMYLFLRALEGEHPPGS